MSKIAFDTSKIDGRVRPLVTNATSSCASALSCAGRVNFPHNDFDWGRVKNSISNCQERLKKFSNWAEDFSTTASKEVQDGLDEINGVDVEQIALITQKVK